MNSDLKSTIVWLDTVSVRFRPKSVETYNRVLALSEDFELLSDTEKEQFSLEVTDSLSKKLLAFSGFFAEIALATKDQKWIRGAILLHHIENIHLDYRENIRYLALIDYAASEIGLKSKKMFLSSSANAPSRAKKCISDYISQSRNSSDISSFGIRVESVEGNPRFVAI